MSKQHSRAPIRILGAGLSGLTAAITLARAGREVAVFDNRGDSGERFAGDFQAIENWTSETDFFDELSDWGIATDSFAATPVSSIDVITARGERERAFSDRIACRLVRRGTVSGSIDQGLKQAALAAGAELHYRQRYAAADCDIIATGPKHATGAVRAEIFHTDHPDQVTLQFDQHLAPGAYTYMVIINGVGEIATVVMDRSLDMDSLLDQTISAYDANYPQLRRSQSYRMTGIGCFAMSSAYTNAGRHFVGEAAGLQDCFWGFGIRYAMTSGYLAAQALLWQNNYGDEIQRRLRPLQMASLSNRWLLERLGPRGLEYLSRIWMWHQQRSGDGLGFIARLYQPSWLHRLIYTIAAKRLLGKVVHGDDGRGLQPVPFRATARSVTPS